MNWPEYPRVFLPPIIVAVITASAWWRHLSRHRADESWFCAGIFRRDKKIFYNKSRFLCKNKVQLIVDLVGLVGHAPLRSLGC